jgi:Ca2+-binding RTX toxin-like protein
VIYNTTTGQLFYDADGSGAGGSQLIATLQGAPSLAATDILAVGQAAGSIIGTNGNDSLVGTAGADSIEGRGGNDTIDGRAGADTLNGGTGDDLYVGVQAIDTVVDAGGSDEVTTEEQVFTLPAGIEDVRWSEPVGGWGGTGHLIGNELDNFLAASATSSGIRLDGMGGNDTFNGSDGSAQDTLDGGEGDDLIFSLSGDDILIGGPGNDTLHGEEGNDTYFVGPGDIATESLSDGNDHDTVFSPVSWTLFADIEDLIFANDGTVTSLTDLAGIGNGSDNLLDARAVTRATLEGRAGNDSLLGGASADFLLGGTGNDSLTGGAGGDSFQFLEAPGAANADLIADFVSGQDQIGLDAAAHANIGTGPFVAGDARFFAGAGATSGQDASDRVVYNTSTGHLFYDADGNGAGASQLIATLEGAPGLAATDIVVVGAATPAPIRGTAGNDSLTGTAGDDSIEGLAGNDTLTGLAGNDTMLGAEGNDVFRMSSGTATTYGTDAIDGGSGFDVVDFSGVAQSAVTANIAAATATMSGGGTGGAGSASVASIEGVIGGDFNDRLIGGGAANRLEGGAGNDTLDGSSGNDTLRGGTGTDSLRGGSGIDQFIFAESAGAANADTVRDFLSGTDELLFENGVLTALGAEGAFGAGDGRFCSGAGLTSGQDSSDRLIYNTTTGQLFYDADGSGAGSGQLVATLLGTPALAATDITII